MSAVVSTLPAVRAGEALGFPGSRMHTLARRHGIGGMVGVGKSRQWDAGEVAAAVVYAELSPPGRQGGDKGTPQTEALIGRALRCARANPDARYVVAHPDWSEPADSPGDVVALVNDRGDCTVVPLAAALERFPRSPAVGALRRVTTAGTAGVGRPAPTGPVEFYRCDA